MIKENFPYSNFHDMNLDWIISKLKETDAKLDYVIKHSTIKYADPIGWNITSQYEANTVVVDLQSGNAYISSTAVPAGIRITDGDYWSIIFNYSNDIIRLEKQIADANEESSDIASASYPVGTLIFTYGKLYRANVNITAGDRFVSGGNVTHITIEELLKEKDNAIDSIRSDLDEEIDTRAESDDELRDAINAEATARESAITSAIEAETSARESAIEAEATTRANADNALDVRVTYLEEHGGGGGAIDPEKTQFATHSKILTVGKRGAQFTTINDAIEEATAYCTTTDRVLILIGEGVYEENITLMPNPGIDLRGAGLSITRIISHANYPESAIYTVGDGYFYGISFESDGENAYGFHFENQTDATSGNLIFDSCRFASIENAGAGIGMGEGSDITFINCHFYTYNNTATALYLHNFPHESEAMYATFIGCNFTNNGGGYPIKIDNARKIYSPTENVSPMFLSFQNCNARNPKIIYQTGTNTTQGFIPNDFSDDIGLLDNSYCPGIPGVDKYLSMRTMRVTGVVWAINGVAILPVPDISRFDVNLSSVTTLAGADITNTCSLTGGSFESILLVTTNETAKTDKAVQVQYLITARKN